MPKTITNTITLANLRVEHIAITRPAPGNVEMTVTYRLLRDDGTIYEVKRVGGIAMPPAVKTAIDGWWDTLVAERKTAEGL